MTCDEAQSLLNDCIDRELTPIENIQMRRYRLPIIQISIAALLGIGCVGTDFITSPVMTVPARITITPATQAILIGGTARFQAVYHDSLDTQRSAPFQWISSDTSIASISDAGVAEGHQAGQDDIQATAHGVASGLARLAVVTNAATSVATVTIASDNADLTPDAPLLLVASEASLLSNA